MRHSSDSDVSDRSSEAGRCGVHLWWAAPVVVGLSFLLSAVPALGQRAPEPTGITSSWYMRSAPAREDLSRASLSQGGWREVDLDDPWSAQRVEGYTGPVWYRKEVRVAPGWDGAALLLGPVYGGWYRVYADGELIGQAGSADRTLPFPQPRLFHLRPEHTADGSVELAIRVYRIAWAADRESAVRGPFGEGVVLGSAETLARRLELRDLRRRVADVLPLGLGILFLLAGAYYLVLYGSRSRLQQRPYLWFGLGSMAFGLNAVAFTSWVAEWLDRLPLAYRVNEASGHLALVFLFLFLWSVLDRSMERPVRGYVWSHVALATFLAVAPFAWILSTDPLRIAWLAPGLVLALWVLVIETRSEHPEAPTLLVGAVVLTVAEILEMARAFFDAPVPHNLPYLGYLAILGCMAYALWRRFTRVHDELDELRVDLERRVSQRTGELADAMRAAERANRAKSEFLSNMSHELRTPLNSVIGFANVIMRRSEGISRRDRDFLERIRVSGEHLLALINDILDLSKIEAGRMDVQMREVNLSETVIAGLEKHAETAGRAGVDLRAEIPRDLEKVRLDPRRFHQVLDNLVDNALKFTPEGSVVVRAETEGRQIVALRVEDTGIGIPEDKLDAVFEAFQQAENTISRRYQGTGLGLPISRSLCHLMGCELEVESEEGEGTTFRVVFPPPILRARAEEGIEHEDGRLVLVIDDDLDAQVLLEEHLKEYGCRVVTADSGIEGLRLARELNPDLVTLDLKMPGMDGWATLRAFKSDPGLRDIPVVVVSVVASESRGTLLGEVDLVSKPVDRDALLEVVGRNLKGRTSRALVVEDDADTRHLLTTLLEPRVDEVRTAENGARALEVLETFDPGVILLDLVMPEMDGMTFLHALRHDPRHAEVPVLVVTSKQLSEAETRVLERATGGILKKGEDLERGGMGTEMLKERLTALLGESTSEN